MDLSTHSTDRRKHGRAIEDRCDQRTRLEGAWTDAERARRVAEVREEHHDRYAITVTATARHTPRSPHALTAPSLRIDKPRVRFQ